MITKETLKERIKYNPESGEIASLLTGNAMGSKDKDGYVVVRLDRKIYKVHRLAFLYMTGSFPKDQVDHINGVRDDNRWCNLRECNMSQNKQNFRAARAGNKSGFLGVSLHKPSGKYIASIRLNGIGKTIGYFATPEEAYASYLKEKRKLHEFCTI